MDPEALSKDLFKGLCSNGVSGEIVVVMVVGVETAVDGGAVPVGVGWDECW